jgi:hypothetical protein
MERLAADPALRRAFGEAGPQRVVEEFDASKAVEPLLERFAGG